jgi:hypothetical protein
MSNDLDSQANTQFSIRILDHIILRWHVKPTLLKEEVRTLTKKPQVIHLSYILDHFHFWKSSPLAIHVYNNSSASYLE